MSSLTSQLLLFGAADQQPQHRRDLSQRKRLAVGEDFVLLPRHQKTCHTERQPRRSIRRSAKRRESAWEEAGPVDKEAEWNEPDPPEDGVGQIELVMQIQEQHGERVALRLVES